MSLTLINYLMPFLLLSLGGYIFYKNPKSVNSFIIFIMTINLSFTAVTIGLTYDMVFWGHPDWATLMGKVSGATVFFIYLMVFRLSLSFPYERTLTAVNILLIGVAIGVAIFILSGSGYIESVVLKQLADGTDSFFRNEGRFYKVVSFGGIALLIASMVIMMVRRARFKNPIFKLQAIIISIGTALAVFIGMVITIIIPSVFGIFWIYPLSAIIGFMLAASLIYGISTTRMFDISAALHKTLIFLGFSSVIIILAGGVFALIQAFLADNIPTVLQFFLYSGIFLSFFFLRGRIQSFIIRLFRRKSDYLSDLDSELAGIDFSRNRDEVIASFAQSLSVNIGTDKIALFSENSIGELESVFSTLGELSPIEKENKSLAFLVNIDKKILLVSEIHTNPLLIPVRDELSTLFHKYGVQALTLMKDNSGPIGLVLLGEKDSLKEYDTYDYKALESVYTRLFTVMYYIRNIERQSVALTVDKELKFSNQIIASLLENMDKIKSPKTEFHFLSKNTSGLGGDYVDTIRLSDTKTLIVVGDVAGKGINAAMSMIILKSVIRTYLRQISDFKQLVVKLNEFIKLRFPKGTFFAGVFILLDTSNDSIFYLNCGIPAMFLYSKNINSVIEVQGEGRVLGFVKDITKFLTIKKWQLNSEDVLLIVTDGILESESLTAERYGKQRVSLLLSENKGKTAQEMNDIIFSDFNNFVSGSINDDVTLVTLKCMKNGVQ